MVKLTIILITLIAGLTFASDPMPDTPFTIYWPEMWKAEESQGSFRMGYWYKDSINLRLYVASSEPEIGYSYHYGITEEINDTIKVTVYFDNRSSQDFVIASAQPETWFYPVLYEPRVDVFTSPVLADTSIIRYKFEHWVNKSDGVITTAPDTIRTRTLHYDVKPKDMVFSIWGISRGSYRVILKPTEYLPQDVKLVVDTQYNTFNIVTTQHTLDTLNSYSMIASNALLRREYTLFNTYVDNMFTVNPLCLPGWALRYAGYMAQGDSVNAKSAIDSLINNAENRIDPFIPDPSKETEFQKYWLEDYIRNYNFEAWRLRNPEEAKYIFTL